MKIRSIVLLITSFFLFLGCYDDNQLQTDITDLQQRVSTIESWCTTANSQISALQSLIQALDNKDYVTGVTPLADGSGYTISFTKSKAITIKNGEKGDTGDKGDKGDKGEDAVAPIIGVALDIDGNYYWTVKIGNGDPTWMVDKDGNKIRTTGDKGADGISPKVRINESTNMWEISVDGGESWVSTGVAATGATGAAGVAPQMRINANLWEISVDGGETWVSTGVAGIGTVGKDGKDGIVPVISIALYSDGNYYWKVNGEWMMVNGKMVPTTGPKGDTGATGPKGDAVFAAGGIDNSNSDYVVFTLANGDNITLPKYKPIRIGEDNTNIPITIQTETLTIPIKLPIGFSESDYSSIMAQMITPKAIASDIKTKATDEPAWEVKVNKPTFVSGVCQDDASVTIKPITGMLTVGDNSTLKVTIVGAEGNKTTASRVITAGAIAIQNIPEHTVSLITKGTPLTEELLTDALAGGNELIINGFLTGEFDGVSSWDGITGDWDILRKFIRNSSTDINLTMNNIVDVIEMGLAYCDKLVSVNLPEATTIANNAFQCCANLATIELPKATSIGIFGFFECKALTTVELPEATILDKAAFKDCSILSTIRIPKVTSIGEKNFSGCRALTTIEAPNATSIGERAFSGCYLLTTIELPLVTIVGPYAFDDCRVLSTIKLPKATTFENSAFYKCVALTTIELPEATSLERSTFFLCENLTTVVLPKATKIGLNTFANCYALTTVELPKANTIEYAAFFRCTKLATIELPMVSSIGNKVFEGCSALTTLKLAKIGNVTLAAQTFYDFNTTNCNLFLGSGEKPATGTIWKDITFKSITLY